MAAAGVVLLVAMQQVGTLGGDDLLGETLTNAAHVPLFALVTLLLHRVLRRPPWHRLLVASLLLALATETMQLLTHRQASVYDLGLDLLGILPVIGALVFERRLRRYGRRGPLGIWCATAALIVVMTVAGPLRVVLAYAERDAMFPTLLVPGARALEPLVSSNSLLSLADGPEDWQAYAHRSVLEVVWGEADYPGVTLAEVVSDWSGFSTLLVDVYLPAGPPMPLTAAVGHSGTQGTARYQQQLVEPGAATLRYALDTLLSPRGEEAARVTRLILHTTRAQRGRSLLIGRVRLSREGERAGAFAGTLAAPS